MAEAKAIINVQTGIVELEGSVDFVSKYLDKFEHLVGRFDENQNGSAKPELTTPEASAVAGVNGRKKKATSKKSGPSCGDRVRELKSEGFFSEPRTSQDVQAALKERATPYDTKHISAALIYQVGTKNLRRIQKGETWLYVNP
jgi:hypothetical protein